MLEAMNSLAACKYFQGQLSPARTLFEKLLEWREELDGVQSAHTLDVATNLAVLLEQQGQSAVAEEIHKRFNDGYESVEKRAADGDDAAIEEDMADLVIGKNASGGG